MKFHEISLHEISLGNFCTSIMFGGVNEPLFARRQRIARFAGPRASGGVVQASSPRCGPGTATAFYVTCVPGPSMLPYNVPNDRTLGPSAGRVQNKQQVAGADR